MVLLVAPLVFRAPDVLCQAGLLGVPVGGGLPASRPRRELRSARRLEARPGPAAHGHRSQAPRFGLFFRGIALLGEALHWLVASAMLRYLVHCFLQSVQCCSCLR